MFERVFIEVDELANKMRLDDFLFERIPTLSRMYLRELIKNERCEVNGAFENAGRKLKPKDFVEISVDPTRGTAMRPENIPLEIIYEDHEIIVVNKPTDMLVHPTHRDKDGTLLNALAYHLNREMLPDGHEVTGEIRQGQNGALSEIKYPRSKIVRPGLVHRLDRQTSGLMVIAKSVRVHRILADHFKKKLVKKLYTARVEGAINQDEGIIDAPIGRYAEIKLWNVKDDGKHSRTRFWVRRRGADSTILELEPVTGRTNQLRIHCSWIGHPIVGDVNRGGRPFRRLCLHAHKLSLKHPASGCQLVFETAIPPDLSA